MGYEWVFPRTRAPSLYYTINPYYTMKGVRVQVTHGGIVRFEEGGFKPSVRSVALQ